jgi:hypothetical protein
LGWEPERLVMEALQRVEAPLLVLLALAKVEFELVRSTELASGSEFRKYLALLVSVLLTLAKFVVVFVQLVEVLAFELELWENLVLLSFAWKPIVLGDQVLLLLQELLVRVKQPSELLLDYLMLGSDLR